MTQTARDTARDPSRRGAGAAPGGAAPVLADLPASRWPARRLNESTTRVTAWYAALPPRRRELVQDTALALVLAVLNLLSLWPYQSRMHPAWLAFLLVGVQSLPLAVRRRWPVLALIGCGVPRNFYDTLGFGYAPLPLAAAIAFATVAERSGLVLRWITVVASACGITWSQLQPGHSEPYDALVQVFLFGAAWTVGLLSRYRRDAVSVAAERAARAVDAAAARAAAAERVRIARELHDVVAHHVSLMAVQAEAVGALLPARPEAAAASADLIGSTARAAMTELRRLLGVLRFKGHEDPEEQGLLTPSPSLARMDELMDAIREAGLPATYAVSGRQAALPPGVDLTAYRIIQEALTNALRHAPGATASVRVTYDPADITIEVTNSARAASAAPVSPSAAMGPGYGLAGIAERVASCGGSLALGPTGEGGFRVTARLPLR